jgi:hypothetical protein
MKTIHKYELKVDDRVVVPVRKGARFLHARESYTREVPTINVWAEVDTDEPLVDRAFCIRGTGHPLTGKEAGYLGTAVFKGGALVFHCYTEVREPGPPEVKVFDV